MELHQQWIPAVKLGVISELWNIFFGQLVQFNTRNLEEN